ncbi:unnamed protein product [Urochloa decumbens]|uniref:KIB1-4 beta-propeller domain-containing protein n=1 Tax=Urochloa decumbens TaxID=240449 RepID=A0ABC8VJM4_9POAL
MSSSGNQLCPAATTLVTAAGNPDAVLPGAGVDVDRSACIVSPIRSLHFTHMMLSLHARRLNRNEERDWANLVGDAVRQIAGKLLADDAAEYVRLRAVCSPWRSATAAPSWEPQFFPRNWLMLRRDVVADAAPAAPVSRRFVNVRTGATLLIRPPPAEEYGDFITGAEGLLLFHCGRTDTVRLFNPLTAATAVLPGLAGAPGIEEAAVELELAAAGVIAADGNAPATASPAVVLVLVMPRTTVILCARPGDDRWRTVDAGEAQPQPFQGGLSMQGKFYVPTRHGEVLRVELYPQPRLMYVARPPGSQHCTCDVAVTSYLVPSLDEDDGAGEDNDGMLLVRVFDGAVDVLGVHLGKGSYTRVPDIGNRTIFLPGLTVRADKLSSVAEMELGSVHLDEDIEDYIIG